MNYDVLTVTLNPAIDRTVQIRNFAAGKVNRVEQDQQDPGGKGVNVAVVLSDAGHTAAVTGFLGRENSAGFEDVFARKQIADHFIRIAGQTRVGIKIIDPVDQETTDINFPGLGPSAEDRAALFDKLATLDATWAVVAGSLPPGIDQSVYRDVIVALKERGCNVALDTSGEPLRFALEAVPQIIKPNIHELETLLGTTLKDNAAIVAAARDLLARGSALVAISMGADGALFVSADEVVSARPPAIAVQSTVGAGDAMVAGIVAAQLRGLSLTDTATLATAFSMDAISRIGAGLSSADAISVLAQRVAVERWTG